MAEERVDTELLIAAVEKRPVLWDKALDLYKSRNATVNAWNDVCSQLLPDFKDMNTKERDNCVQGIIKRWRNIRDSWLRAQRRAADEKRSGSCAKPVKTFIYDAELQFLLKVANPNSAESSFSFDQDTQKPESPASPSSSFVCKMDRRPRNITPIPKKRPKFDEIDQEIMETLSALKERDNDRHLSFFKGIIPTLHQFDEGEVLEFQAGVIQLIQNIRMRRSTRPAQFH